MPLLALLPALKVWVLIKLVFYRVSVWSGTAYLYRRGKKTKKKIFYAAAALVYAASWVLVILSILSVRRLVMERLSGIF